MFIGSDKIGHMEVSKEQMSKINGAAVKKDFDNKMAETEKRHEAEQRQHILDILSGNIPDV